jgi:hypothetical protein
LGREKGQQVVDGMLQQPVVLLVGHGSGLAKGSFVVIGRPTLSDTPTTRDFSPTDDAKVGLANDA